MSLLRAYGREIDRLGRRLGREQIYEISQQLQRLRFIQSGYLCLLVPKDVDRDWLCPELDNSRISIGVGIKTQSIFPFIFELMQALPQRTDFKIEIPVANVILTQLLVSVPKEDMDTQLKIYSCAGKIPEEEWLPVISPLSETCVISDYTQAYKKLLYYLQPKK